MQPKTLPLLLGCVLFCSYVHAQLFEQRSDRHHLNNMSFETTKGKAANDTAFKDYPLNYTVTKMQIRDKRVVDSLFSLAHYYLADALKGDYHRIVVTITTKGIFFKEQVKFFSVNALLAERKAEIYSLQH